jgi:hypothetical protein
MGPTAHISYLSVISRLAEFALMARMADMLCNLCLYVKIVLEMGLAHMAPAVVTGRLRHKHGSLGA